MKSAEKRMNIVDEYRELGSYRAAAEACGTTHKTVKRVVEAAARGEVVPRRRQPRRVRHYDGVRDLVFKRVKGTRGRISAKRLLPAARAEGYEGSARNFRRLVVEVKREWRSK